MTLNDKLFEIEENFAQWIASYRRGELVVNPIRIIGEAICKSTILRLRGDIGGTRIIEGQDTNIPKKRNSNTSVNQPLEFSELIRAVNEINGFRQSTGISEHLYLIKALTNPGSHSTNHASDATKPEDMRTLYNSISVLLRWLYVETLQRQLPTVILDSLQQPSEATEEDRDDVAWNNFMSKCRDFQPRRQYILVSPEEISEDVHIADAINRIPWRLIVDFNTNTDIEEHGLLYNFNKSYGSGYKKSFTIEDRLEFDPKFHRYWFLANGQNPSVPALATFPAWRRKYKRYLSETLYKAFDKGSHPRPRVVVLLNIVPEYANAIIDEFNAVDNENLEFILCNNGLHSYDSFISNYDNVSQIIISPAQIAKGIRNTISFSPKDNDQHQILIPYKNDKQETSYVTFKAEDYDYLKSLGIDLVYKGIEKEEKADNDPDDFYKGGIITWSDLAEEKDIIRHSYEGLLKRLRIELSRNNTKEIELVHEAGAGGTTVARRLAYDLCDAYPTVVLKQYEPKKTIGGLRIIYDQYINSSLPLLIILELFELKSSSQLYRDLGNVGKNAVILVVKRGNLQGRDGKFTLRAELYSNEIPSFENRFSQLVPTKKSSVQSIKSDYSATPRYISPFLYGLVTYERDFKGIDTYVTKCIDDLNDEQRKLIAFVCIIYHFTQHSVPGEFFTALFNTTREKCDLVKLLGEQSPVFEILHENYDGLDGSNTWRPRYAMLGEEAMKIILAGDSGHKNNWQATLGQWLIELIKYVKLAMPSLYGETKQIFDSLFINRGDYDGNEGRDQFTDAVKTLDSTTAGVAVFEALTDAYPEEAHFHGHFARYLYKPDIGIKNYDRAIEEANISLEKQGNDPTLVHTLGMCYKEKAEGLIANSHIQGVDIESIEEKVKSIVELACDAFDRSINLDVHNLYGHVTQSRLILKTLDFGFRLHSGTTKERFISDPLNDWYAKLLDKAGNLLEDANYIIEQATGLDNKARSQRSADYVKDCEGKYLIEMGQSLVAKSRYEHLIKNTPSGYQFMIPRYRSLFVRCLLASKIERQGGGYADAWEKLSESELIQCIGYLRENILADPTNSHNIRLWLQAVRYLKTPPSIDECISLVATWCQITNQNANSLLEGLYYLYVLNATKAISSSGGFDPSSVHTVRDIMDRMRGLAKNEKYSFEWYGTGTGIQQVKNHRTLGEFNPNTFFLRNANILMEVTGRIKEAANLRSGKIILDCGLEAFFVPAIGGFTEKNINDRVKFYVGFRYDQLDAWDVVPINYDRTEKISEEDEIDDQLEDDKDTGINDATNFEIQKPVKAPKTPVPINLTQKQQLPGLTIVGKVILPASGDDNKKKSLEHTPSIPTTDKTFHGTITKLNISIGLIKTNEVDRNIFFHATHLRNGQFNKLRIGQKVGFKLAFGGVKAKLDRDGKNYLAKEVRIL